MNPDYTGYLFWCSEGCGFVERDHRCEQWSRITYCPPKMVQALRNNRPACCGAGLEALDTNALEAALSECAKCPWYGDISFSMGKERNP